MEAKDTVMSPEQYESFTKEADKLAADYANATEGNFKQSDIEAIYTAADLYALIKQAEISFAAGKAAGRKEVLGWVESRMAVSDAGLMQTNIDYIEWQAFFNCRSPAL